MSPRKLTQRIDIEFRHLEVACHKHGEAGRMLNEALRAALVGEKIHRRMGRRFTSGVAGYRISAYSAAKSIILRWVTDPQCSEALPPERLLVMRLDVAYCYAIRRMLGAAAEALPRHDVDYATEIAA